MFIAYRTGEHHHHCPGNYAEIPKVFCVCPPGWFERKIMYILTLVANCPNCKRVRKPNITLYEGKRFSHQCSCGHVLELEIKELNDYDVAQQQYDQNSTTQSQTSEK